MLELKYAKEAVKEVVLDSEENEKKLIKFIQMEETSLFLESMMKLLYYLKAT